MLARTLVLVALALALLGDASAFITVNRAMTDAEVNLLRQMGVDVTAFYASRRLDRTVLTTAATFSSLPADVARLLATSFSVEPDVMVRTRSAIGDTNGSSTTSGGQLSPQDATNSWGLDRIDQRDRPLDGRYTPPPASAVGVHVYVADTGIDVSHAEFGGRATQDWTAFGSTHGDCNGHGTHVAGIVGSASWGVADNVRIHAVRVLDCQGSGTVSSLVQGLMWVYDNHVAPAVVNLSLGLYADISSFSAIIQDLVADGVFVVAAAGNDARDACGHYPSAYPFVVSVGATTSSDQRASFSNWGANCVDIFAPGADIRSTWPGDGTRTLSGTSMATPMLSGAAALVLADNPSANVRDTIMAAATTGRIQDTKGSPNRLLYVGANTPSSPSSSRAPSSASSSGGSSTTVGGHACTHVVSLASVLVAALFVL